MFYFADVKIYKASRGYVHSFSRQRNRLESSSTIVLGKLNPMRKSRKCVAIAFAIFTAAATCYEILTYIFDESNYLASHLFSEKSRRAIIKSRLKHLSAYTLPSLLLPSQGNVLPFSLGIMTNALSKIAILFMGTL